MGRHSGVAHAPDILGPDSKTDGHVASALGQRGAGQPTLLLALVADELRHGRVLLGAGVILGEGAEVHANGLADGCSILGDLAGRSIEVTAALVPAAFSADRVVDSASAHGGGILPGWRLRGSAVIWVLSFGLSREGLSSRR